MFGNPSWFRKKTVGWGVHPVSWKGWLYAVVWAVAICVPFVALLARHLLLESLVWAVVMMVALLWDVHHVRRQMETARKDEEPDILVIDDTTEPDPSYYATPSYDLHLRHKQS